MAFSSGYLISIAAIAVVTVFIVHGGGQKKSVMCVPEKQKSEKLALDFCFHFIDRTYVT